MEEIGGVALVGDQWVSAGDAVYPADVEQVFNGLPGPFMVDDRYRQASFQFPGGALDNLVLEFCLAASVSMSGTGMR